MKPTRHDIYDRRGDTVRRTFTLTDDDGTPSVLTGTFLMQSRRNPDHPQVLATWVIDDSQKASGIVVATLPGDVSATMPRISHWDLQNTNASDEPSTLLYGVMDLGRDTSR